ncbi:MAG: N-acetylmuramoyl-L-alanine amidase [Chlorobiaceae bacterium]|nr:N-acetylmuramoyl-L-alanine amidase [Chlorobiaceae bacterium]
MQVSTGSGQGYNIKVQGIRDNSALLVDVGSMSRALRLRNVFDGSRMQIDEGFGTPGSSFLLSPGSSFSLIVPADGSTGKRLLQLPSAPVLRQGRIYLPVTQACRIFALWLDRDLTYDVSNGHIRASVSGRRSGSPLRSIGLLPPDDAVDPSPAPAPAQPGQPQAIVPPRIPSGQSVIEDVRVETLANGCVVRMVASGGESVTSYLRPDENGNAYLTIEKASGNLARLTKRYSDGGVVRSVTPLQLPGGALQFTVALNTSALNLKSSSFQYDPKTGAYLLYVMSDVDVEAIRRTEKERQIQQQLSRDVSKWKLDAVVIDAGHGGKDPGAIGTRGTKEKDVVLNIATDLGMFVKQRWPGVKVIYTRKDDRFIQLNERGKIANRYAGKLFVSIHCNSTPSITRARGTEVYILGPHKTQAALDVAMFENAVISREENARETYKGFSDEFLIMSSMAQSAFATQSTELAQDVLRKAERYGSNGFGVRQAGFMVLWTPSMPSILVETGYLSNPDEEKILRSREQQAKIAFGIFQGLQQYRASYENRQLAAGARADD